MSQLPPLDRTFAKKLRSNSTDAERALWNILRARRLGRLKFRRQEHLEGYIADFVCYEAMVVIEADGGQHSESKRNAERDRILAAAGYKTLRFWNNDILSNPDGVATDILRAVESFHSPLL